MANERVDYKQGAKVGDVVKPEDLPSRRVDDAPDRDAALSKGGGEGTRNVNAASPRDAALESD
ncbi:MAG TPA: hypothetical protein VNX21_06135 [Candidatus Thermoplasmatota archaeon]|nr:hypothetical protein [Candidatus Thermoplasmatota archaeon]